MTTTSISLSAAPDKGSPAPTVSWLKEKRLAAGFETAQALGERIGAVQPSGRSMVDAWERRVCRPSWRWIEPLAEALNTSVDEVLEHLWGEKPGDPCPLQHGCGGHKVRPEDPNSHVLPISVLCARCGERFQGSPSDHGLHHNRHCYVTPDVPCIDCGNPMPGRRFRKGRRRCDECERKTDRHTTAQNDGMALIDAELKRLGLSRGDLSQEIGCHRYYLAVAAAKKTWHPRRREAGEITAKLNIPLSQLLANTNGTWEEWLPVLALAARVRLRARQAARAANSALANFLGDFLVAQVRDLGKRGDMTALEALQQQLLRLPLKRHPSSDVGGGWTRGRPKNPNAVTKMMATKSERGQLKAPPFLEFNRSAEGRALLPLWAHLKHRPRPNSKQFREWARRTAARLDSSPAHVIATWKPHLVNRGVWSNAGRKALDDRYGMVKELMAAWPRRENGQLKYGFWPHAANEVSRAEGIEQHPLSGRFLKRWWQLYLKAQELTG